jgi:hypothetical protein
LAVLSGFHDGVLSFGVALQAEQMVSSMEQTMIAHQSMFATNLDKVKKDLK